MEEPTSPGETTHHEHKEDRVHGEDAETNGKATNPVETTDQDGKDTAHGEDKKAKGNKSEKASLGTSREVDALQEKDQQQQTRTSNRKRRPPEKISNGFL
jgi:hypothetical protein